MAWDSKTWLGLMGGGFSGSLVLGGSAYQCNLWRMDGHRVPMMVMITGFRAGIVAQIEAGHMICLLQNVSKPSDFKTIKSSGLDWSAGTGVDWDAVIKSGSKVAKEVIKAVGKAAAKEVGNWAAQESVKKAVQGLMGDYSLKPKGQSFMMLPTPAALSAGAGIFYEWQTMSHVGTDQSYKYIPPKWGFHGSGTGLRLLIKDIPEPEGKRLCLLIESETVGLNETLHFGKSLNERPTRSNDEVWITVRSGRAYVGNEEGVPIGKMHIIGHTDGAYVTMPKEEKANYKNKTIKFRFGISRGRTNLYKWTSDDYVKVTTDDQARITSASDTTWQD